MKIKISLIKLADKQFKPALQRVMEKWPEPKDVHALVKIAKAVESEMKDYFDAAKALSETHGYDLGGRKSVAADEITDALLQKYGKMRPDGQLTLAGASEQDAEDFFKAKSEADDAMQAFSKANEALLNSEVELDFPRKVKVTDKLVKKEVITGYDCFLLEPFLDLSGVSDLEPEAEADLEE
jgi:hypothetical protein